MYIRQPVVAGSFYPGEPDKLKSMINGFLSNAEADKPKISGNVYGIISPHAGYVYSGPVAGYGFSYLSQLNIDTYIILAPSHRARFKGASVIPRGIYSTPLGDVNIDSDIGEELIQLEGFGFIPEAHELEHSLEVQVPFVQVVSEGAKIVPLVMGTTDLNLCRRIGESIASVIKNKDKSYAVIISTDLSHYHSYNSAVELDNKIIKSIESFDENKLSNLLQSGKAEACGEGPLISGMYLCRSMGAKKATVVKYANSGDTAGSKDRVVGYLSAVYYSNEEE